MMRAACQRSVSLINSKAKSNTILVSLSFFFFHVADIDLPARCNRTLRIIKLRAPRVPEKKKEKEKTAAVRIYTRARARANILIVPFQPYRFALPPPPSRPCPKTRTYVAPVKRSPNSRTGGYFRKCVAAQSNLAKFLGRAIKGLPPFAPYHDVSPAAGVLRIVRPSLARVCSLFACSAKNRSRFLSSTIVARRKQG